MRSEQELEGGERTNGGVNGKTEIKAGGNRDQRPQGRTALFRRDLRLEASDGGGVRVNYRGSDDDGLCCCLAARSRLTFWDPTACSTPGLHDGLRGQQRTLDFIPSEVGNPRRTWSRGIT